MSEIRFEEPPGARASRQYDHAAIVAALRARPSEWAIVMTYPTRGPASAMAESIKAAKNQSYAPAGSFEAVVRRVDAEARVYARYVGAEVAA